jgi:hypothetical protein
MANGIGINTVAALPSEIANDDLLLVARNNVVYSTAAKNVPSRHSPRIQLTKPLLTDFPTWVNQGGYADVTQLDDGIRMHVDRRSFATNARCRVRSLPGGSWDVKLGCVCGFQANANNAQGGLVLRESSTGKLLFQAFGINTFPGWLLNSYANPTTFNAVVRSWPERGMQIAWFRFAKNGSVIDSYVSNDGVAWKLMDSGLALTTPFTTAPDQWGFMMENQLALPAFVDVIDWDE